MIRSSTACAVGKKNIILPLVKTTNRSYCILQNSNNSNGIGCYVQSPILSSAAAVINDKSSGFKSSLPSSLSSSIGDKKRLLLWNDWRRDFSKIPFSDEKNTNTKSEIEQPAPALNYNFASDSNNNYSSSSGGKMGPETTRPPSTSSSSGRLVGFKNTTSSGGGGGSGGGRYRCPKCNTLVSFRPSSEFEVNTFYCSTCALWYMATGGGTVGSSNQLYQVKRSDARLDDASKSKHEEFLTFAHNPSSDNENTNNTKFTMNGGDDNNNNNKRTGNTSSSSQAAEYMDDTKHDESGGDDQQTVPAALPTPLDICRGLNEYVIGQTNVKIALSVGVHNHYKRLTIAEAHAAANKRQFMIDNEGITNNINDRTTTTSLGDNVAGGLSDLNMSQYGRTSTSYPSSPSVPNTKSQPQQQEQGPEDTAFCETPDINSIMNPNFARSVDSCEIDKSNIIIIGPTGSGKTLVVKTLAKLIDVPLVVADATCLTQAGYVGEDVESILFKLYLESGQDLERCQRGIIYLDETDKIRKSGSNVSISRDVSGEGVQHALLKIVEGHVINVPKEPGRKNPRGDFLQIDTTNILFICGGAFSGLERIINRRLDASSIGFGASMKKDLENGKVTSKYFDSAIPKDLVDYGMIPEFIGRFPVVVSTKGLNVKNLVEILTVPKNSLLKQYEYLFAMNDVTLHVTSCALEEIAKTAHKRGSGARGLRSITENVLMETMFVVPSLPDVHTVYLDANAVRGERKPILLKDPEMTVERYEHLMKDKDSNSDELFDGAEYVNLDDTFDGDFGEAVA